MCVTIESRIRSPLATKEILEFIIWVASSPSWFAMFRLDHGTEERIETKRRTGMHPTCVSNLAIWPLLGRTKFLIHHPHKTPCYWDFEAAHMLSIVEMDIMLHWDATIMSRDHWYSLRPYWFPIQSKGQDTALATCQKSWPLRTFPILQF